MPENAEESSTSPSRFRRARRPSLAPREVVLGLDNLEHGISLFGVFIAFMLALVTAIEWDRNLPVRTTVKFVKGKYATKSGCPAAFSHHVNTLCEHVVHLSRGYWESRFFFIIVVALCLLYFTLRRKRAGVACFSIFLGLGLGIEPGLVFFFMGAWLIVRAYRLQKYGVPTLLGSNRVAREIGTAKRDARSSPKRDASGSSPTAIATPTASKRYTPKKPPRRRR